MTTVKLRAIEPEDLDMLYRIENDTQLWNVGATNVPYSRYTLHDYIATSSDDIYADRQVRMMVENAEGQAVGMADLINFAPQHLRAETGIVIVDVERRKGYGCAALDALCDYARRVLHLHQLYGVVAVNNRAALMLYQKAGFSRQSVLKEWLCEGDKYADAVVMQRFL